MDNVFICIIYGINNINNIGGITSKQKLFLQHKDDIMIKLSQCQSKNFVYSISNNKEDCIEAEAVNQGWVQALKWVLGFGNLYKVAPPEQVIIEDDEIEPFKEDE